jgi:tetratricopeptide (TPR) repeat protein
MGIQRGVQDKEIFVGRENDLRAIGAFLCNREESRSAYLISGGGGLGKTILIEQARKQFDDLVAFLPEGERPVAIPVLVDFYHLINKTRLGLMFTIASAISQDEAAVFEPYRPAFRRFLEDLNAYVGVSSQSQTDVSPLTSLESRDKLFEAFYSALEKVLASFPLVLFLDTFEGAVEVSDWLLNSFLPRFENRLRAVIAGRPGCEPQDPKNVIIYHLAPFSREDVFDFLRQKNLSLPDEELGKLVAFTHGRPILTALASDWLNRGHTMIEFPSQESPKNIDWFEGALVEKIKEFEYPENQLTMYMAHVHHRFNVDILKALLQSEGQSRNHQDDLERMIGLSFVKYRPGQAGSEASYVLHDEMREMVLKHVWAKEDPEGTQRVDLSRRVISYYDHRIETTAGQLEALSRHVLEAERLYHQLYMSPKLYARSLWSMADAAHDAEQTDDLAVVIAEAEKVLKDRALPNDGLRVMVDTWVTWKAVDSSTTDDQYKEALDTFKALLPSVKEFRVRGSILLGMGTLAGRLNLRRDAIKYYQEALTLYEQDESFFKQEYLPATAEEVLREREELYRSIGYTYRRQGDWAKAEENYKKSLRLAEESRDSAYFSEVETANTENNLGFILRLEGKMQEARAYCTKAFQKRLRQVENEWPIALSYNTLGLIDRDEQLYEEALRKFRQVLSIVDRLPAGRNVISLKARALRNIGSVYNYLMQPQEALDYLHASERLNVSVEAPNTYNKLGRAYWALRKEAEAERYFLESIAIAQDQKDAHLHMDSLVQMALLRQVQGKFDEKDGYIKEVRELWDDGYKFDYHLGTLERGLGDYCFERSEFEEAFRHYAEALVYLGRFTSLQYRQVFRQVSEKTIELHPDVVEHCSKIMKARWEREPDLIDLHPEVLELVS